MLGIIKFLTSHFALLSVMLDFADDLASSDPPEPSNFHQDNAIGQYHTREPTSEHNEHVESAPSRSHSQQSSLSNSCQSPVSQNFFSPGPSSVSSSSVLGRRSRDGSAQPWSGREKVRIREFALEKCVEFELSASDAKSLMRESEVCHMLINAEITG